MHIGTSSFQLTVSEMTFIKYRGCLLYVFDHLAASGGPGTSQEVSTEFLRGAGDELESLKVKFVGKGGFGCVIIVVWRTH